jgi:hypothetical protein
MKKLGVLLFLALGVVLLGGNALAQTTPVGDGSYYFVTYYSNANIPADDAAKSKVAAGAPSAVLRIVNDGDASTSETEGKPNGSLWASIYVFDDSQELQECGTCYISADGILSEWVNSELLSNPLTGKVNYTGVIKVIGSTNPDPTNNKVKAGLHGTATHIQNASTYWAVTETALADSNLVSAEQTALQDSCSFAITLGSGAGTITCTPEDDDF